MDRPVQKIAHVIPINRDLLADIEDSRAHVQTWLAMSPEQREAAAALAAAERAVARAAAPHVLLSIDRLIDALGFTAAYAEHLVQPYCYCGPSDDGWLYCVHACDEGLAP